MIGIILANIKKKFRYVSPNRIDLVIHENGSGRVTAGDDFLYYFDDLMQLIKDFGEA